MADNFAPYPTINGCFVVLNTSPQVKIIKIFNYPILYGQTRDLLKIPGVSENDIRASLLKGELQHKIRATDIAIVCSDIDLVQFNDDHKTFLQSAGIMDGLEIGSKQITPELDARVSGGGGGGSGITANEHQTLRQLIHFIDNGPGDGFASGAVRVTSPSGNPFPTSITWYLDNTQTTKLVEKLITYNSDQFPITITWNIYNFDGVTVVHTVVDTISYSGSFETSRVRSIS